jgi:hypothetical protein
MRGRVFTWLDVVWNVMKILSLGASSPSAPASKLFIILAERFSH